MFSSRLISSDRFRAELLDGVLRPLEGLTVELRLAATDAGERVHAEAVGVWVPIAARSFFRGSWENVFSVGENLG